MYLQKHQGLRFHAEYSVGWQKFQIWVRECTGDTEKAVRLETYPVPDACTISEPTMRMSMEEVQALMDSLWNAGVRPSDLRGHKDLEPIIRAKDEVIAAKNGHIKDLRAISVDTL
jgi:hypothetical protein